MTTTEAPAPPQLKTINLDIDGDIGTLTLNRPKVLNAMSPELIGELVVAAAWLADRAPLRALIVTGEGRAFSAGGDVTWFKRGLDESGEWLSADVRRGAEVLHQAIVDFRRIPYPVIGAINGVAAGAGFSLALMCDIRIASEDAAFVCAYGRIGASPDGGMTYFLPRVVGPSRALQLLLEDPILGADQAREDGIVSEVVPADVQATRGPEPREQPHRPPPGRAARHRRQHGHRGPPRGRHRLPRRPPGRVSGPLSGREDRRSDAESV
jgi:enoyl-CoA hydratase/carnithine racemase